MIDAGMLQNILSPGKNKNERPNCPSFYLLGFLLGRDKYDLKINN